MMIYVAVMDKQATFQWRKELPQSTTQSTGLTVVQSTRTQCNPHTQYSFMIKLARASQFSLFMIGTATHANQLIPSQTKIETSKFVYGCKETHISSLVRAFLYFVQPYIIFKCTTYYVPIDRPKVNAICES